MKRREADDSFAASSKKLIKSTGSAVSTLPVKVSLLEVLRGAPASVSQTDRALGNMERSFKRGDKPAAAHALRYCAENKLTVPRWALEGWAAYQGDPVEKTEHPWITMLRIMAVMKCSKQRYLCHVQQDRYNDKYTRAARYLDKLNPRLFGGLRVLAGAEAIKKTYLKFIRTGIIGGIPLFSIALSDSAWAKLNSTPIRPHHG